MSKNLTYIKQKSLSILVIYGAGIDKCPRNNSPKNVHFTKFDALATGNPHAAEGNMKRKSQKKKKKNRTRGHIR